MAAMEPGCSPHDAPIDVAAALPERVCEPFRSLVVEAALAVRAELGARLVSLVLFGSVARGAARPPSDSGPGSDIDLLVVAEGFPRPLWARRKPLLARCEERRARQGLPAVEWNLVTKLPEEARAHSPLYLDIVEDGILLHDRRGFFAGILAAMREGMRKLGSRRVVLEDGSWYWDLKPDYRLGEVIEI
jgi:hypothetical protein